MNPRDTIFVKWTNNHNRTAPVTHASYTCGYCDKEVGPREGFYGESSTGVKGERVISRQQPMIYICPVCGQPTYFNHQGMATPGVSFGRAIKHVPCDLALIYDEARQCMAINAYTAAVLLARKALMHIAVEEKAEEGLSFAKYVKYFQDNNLVPKGTNDWIDQIRSKANEANHEIVIMKEDDAKKVLRFLEMLLALVYEYPEEAKQ